MQNPANNFDRIRCEYKTGVDPEVTAPFVHNATSDEYFDSAFTEEFDLIFIDGDHTKEQVKRDFENSLRCLSDKGFIVIHDVLPENEQGTLVPRQTKQWWGDVYKWAMTLRNYLGIRFVTFNIDNGCMLIWKDESAEPYTNYVGPCDWQVYQTIGKVLLNVTDAVEI